MILKRIYDEKLAQASYLVGCAASGEALVVDPNRDVDAYLRAAEAEGVEITHVTETHIHADFVSGARELAARTGAQLLLSGEGGERWRYAFAKEHGAVLLRDGDTFEVGRVRFDVLHTPGHTPEHLSFLVTDAATADRPIGALTGDFLFVGDVGRPDLLERAAGMAGTAEAAARTLFRSLRRFAEQPDYLQVWPGHGAGSACGKGLSSVPHSTVGYERRFNLGFSIEDEEEFVRAVLSGQPEAPAYFAEMKRINREGPPLLGGLPRPPRLPGPRLPEVLGLGGTVIDTRTTSAFAAGHVPGTINLPLNGSFTTRAGWLVPYGRDFHLLLDDSRPGALEEAVRDLAMVGLDRVAGYFGTDALAAWEAEGRPLGTVPQATAAELAEKLAAGEVEVIDVRGAAEWEAGHLPGVRNVPLGHLVERLDEIPTDRPLVVHCQGGGRSSIAASVLRARGFRDVTNLRGGYSDWAARDLPTERGAGTPGDPRDPP